MADAKEKLRLAKAQLTDLNAKLKEVKEKSPKPVKNKNAFLNAYLVNSELGNPTAAIENIDKYNALSPGEGDMYYSRALELRKMGQEQAALIAGCLPNPKKFNPGKPSKYLLNRQAAITRLMRLIGESYFERYADGIPEKELDKEKDSMDDDDEDK